MRGITVAVVGAMVVFALLAWWQYGRVYRPVDGYSAEPTAVGIDALAPLGAEVAQHYLARQVTADGTYTGQVVVSGHDLAGTPVSWVVSELRLPDHSGLLVVRGWVTPGDQQLSELPAGAVAVTGRLQAGSPLPGAPRTLSGLPLRSGYVVRTAQSPPDPLSLQPVPVDPPASRAPSQFHLQNAIYVVQWLLLIGVVAFGWWRLRRAAIEVGDDSRTAALVTPEAE